MWRLPLSFTQTSSSTPSRGPPPGFPQSCCCGPTRTSSPTWPPRRSPPPTGAAREPGTASPLHVLPLTLVSIRQQWEEKGLGAPRRIKDPSLVLAGFCRCVSARRILLALLDRVYRRVWDEDSQSFFYSHLLLGDSQWTKSPLYAASEPPLLLSQAPGERSRRLVPTANRLKP